MRVEFLEVRENGDVKFRIWFYRWLHTRPQQPFVDVESTLAMGRTPAAVFYASETGSVLLPLQVRPKRARCMRRWQDVRARKRAGALNRVVSGLSQTTEA